MLKKFDFLTERDGLNEICEVPDKIISVYALEQHVWADSHSEKSCRERLPNLQTIEEFQIDPGRPFLTDILRHIAAPYNPQRKDNPIGQGYWIQAEFGSGKSHLLCLLAALALGNRQAWEKIRQKEEKTNRGKRESLYRFWEEGLEAKSSKGKRGIFVIVKTLVGAGGGTIGIGDKGGRLAEYILDAAKKQLQLELGKNLSLYPPELLADRFIQEDMERYRLDLSKFLRDPRFFDEDEYEDVGDFIRDIQQNKTPDYKRSCGHKLWRFYTEYLKVKPQIAAETEDVLKNMVETILAEGYSGVLLILDEMSLFMKNRDDQQRTDDEQTLVVLANKVAKIHNLPLWTVCSAQQAIESKMGAKNIIADDRLKLVKLLEEDKDYYNIVLSRVREIKKPEAISSYYLYYKRGFTWPNSIGEEEFSHFFPFHKPALEVLRSLTYELTTARSAIHFMHQTLKYQMKSRGRELIRLWELFDEAVRYEESPSGTNEGLVAIKTKCDQEYKAYESCKRQVDGLTKGYLKVHRDKSVKVIQTLFLYYLAKTRQQGITSEEIANSVLIERAPDASPDENIQHYETVAENLKKELRQIVQSLDDDNRSRYRFDPVFTGIDPRIEFLRARDEVETHEVKVRDAWEHLLSLAEWPVQMRQMTINLAYETKSIFYGVAPQSNKGKNPSSSTPAGNPTISVIWQGRQVSGLIGMYDLGRIASDNLTLPVINSDQTDLDFAVFISTRHVPQEAIDKLLTRCHDPRVLFWSPGELTSEEVDRLLDFTAYRMLINDWQGKGTDDALAVINWVANTLQTEIGRIIKIVDASYSRGRIDSLDNRQMKFHVAGELTNILTPLIDQVLTATYESRRITFEPPHVFKKEEAVKLINGIIKEGSIPRNVKPNKDISAAQNFGFGLNIIKKSAEKQLDFSGNPLVQDIWNFIDDHMTDDSPPMKIEAIYKNFMGIRNSWNGKSYGLTRSMVQIFILCLMRQGKIRASAGPKSGLPFALIDYSNMSGITFSTKILDSFAEIQKVAKPKNWEILRSYAEILLAKTIPSTYDDAEILKHRADLRDLFHREKEESARTESRAKSLFEFLKASNPYEKELSQIVKFFSMDIEGVNDIDLILYNLQEAFEYQTFHTGKESSSEVEDLANRFNTYRRIQNLLLFENELRTARRYGSHPLPKDHPDLIEVLQVQQKLTGQVADLRTFIDSEVKLKTELIGKIPPEKDGTGTLEKLIYEYTTIYQVLHEKVITRIDKARKSIEDIVRGEEFKALQILERIDALQPSVSQTIEQQLTDLIKGLFYCKTPSPGSIKEQLKSEPVHECGLSFQTAGQFLESAAVAERESQELFNAAFQRKLELFFNQKIRERLSQGQSEPQIAEILKCESLTVLQPYMVRTCLADPSFIETINHYLKRIVMKRVKISDFKPSINTLEKGQISNLVEEFKDFLQTQLYSIEADDDTLPMLQLD